MEMVSHSLRFLAGSANGGLPIKLDKDTTHYHREAYRSISLTADNTHICAATFMNYSYLLLCHSRYSLSTVH